MIKSFGTLIKPTRGSGEHMVDESVYQIQIGWEVRRSIPVLRLQVGSYFESSD